MDGDRGALLAWMSIIYFRRDAKHFRDPKPYLPDLPVLGELLSTSWKYAWTDACLREVYLLGEAAGYPFSKFLSDLELPHLSYGSCSANPIVLDSTSESWSLGTSDTESGGNLTMPCGGHEVPDSPGRVAEVVVEGPVAPTILEGAVGSDFVMSVENKDRLPVAEGGQMNDEVAVVGSDGVASLVDAPLRSDDAALLRVIANSVLVAAPSPTHGGSFPSLRAVSHGGAADHLFKVASASGEVAYADGVVLVAALERGAPTAAELSPNLAVEGSVQLSVAPSACDGLQLGESLKEKVGETAEGPTVLGLPSVYGVGEGVHEQAVSQFLINCGIAKLEGNASNLVVGHSQVLCPCYPLSIFEMVMLEGVVFY